MNPATDIASLPGVAGMLHHRRDLLLSHRLPADFPMPSALALCAAVSQAFAAYASAGRSLREAWFEFPGCFVLVVVRPAESPEEFLTLLMTDRSSIADATRAANRCWRSS
jgi:hypothetical protein